MQNEISNMIETKFVSASAGKVFVVVGILQLIERGKIKFDDTLGILLDMPLNDIEMDDVRSMAKQNYQLHGIAEMI